MLKVDDVHAGYSDGPDVLTKVSIEVVAGESVALVGLNGAGKSTIVKVVGGLIPTRGGRVTFLEEDVTKFTADERARRGLMLVPEGRQLFAPLTVAETLRLGMVPIARSERARKSKDAYEKVFALFPRLADRRGQAAGTLSGGEQQMLAIGRALMSSPKLLVLDEPSLGLAPQLVEQIFTVLRDLNQAGLAILLIEQNAAIALEATNRAYVLELGRASGSVASSELSRSGALSDISGTRRNPGIEAELVQRPPLPEYSGVPASGRSGLRV
jgi:branched-chain amino acid transport system ATP-binding protein